MNNVKRGQPTLDQSCGRETPAHATLVNAVDSGLTKAVEITPEHRSNLRRGATEGNWVPSTVGMPPRSNRRASRLPGGGQADCNLPGNRWEFLPVTRTVTQSEARRDQGWGWRLSACAAKPRRPYRSRAAGGNSPVYQVVMTINHRGSREEWLPTSPPGEVPPDHLWPPTCRAGGRLASEIPR